MKTVEEPAPRVSDIAIHKANSGPPKLAINPNTAQYLCPLCGASRYTLRLMLNSASWEAQVTARIVISNCPDCKSQNWGI